MVFELLPVDRWAFVRDAHTVAAARRFRRAASHYSRRVEKAKRSAEPFGHTQRLIR